MKKILIIIIILFSYLIAKELLDNRPFKFEKYKNNKQLDAALAKQFPVGSDIREAITVLEKSGAKCEERSKSTFITNEYDKYDLIYWCEYESGWFSLHLLEFYTMWLMGDKNYKLMHIGGEVTKGIVI
ncbi:hypothetical protein NOVO_02220 [Rickettsiales bacterium Ac37b]|nr:hypothetical protein NOVO_02220 [Rickettsiales bacterium Ac37b]